MGAKRWTTGAAATGIVGAAMLLAACGSSPTAAPVANTDSLPASTTVPTTSAPTSSNAPSTTAPPATTPSSSTPATTSKAAPVPTTAKPKPPPTTTKPTPKPVAQGAPCSAAARACIDLSANKSWLLQDGKVVYGPVPITHGRPGHRTPPGSFRVTWKDIDHKSGEFNGAPMPFSVFFNGGIAFHQGSLKDLSHGCIHLSKAAAKTYFDSLKVGDVVEVVR